MKRVALVFLCVLTLGIGSAAASPLVLSDTSEYYLGSIIPNTPSNPGNEVDYITYLVGMALGASVEDAVGVNDLTRSWNDLTPYALPVVFVLKEENTAQGFDNVIDATGILYVLAKYGAAGGDYGAHVWYNPSGFSGDVEVPASVGTGLSHISLYNQVSVPDGGTTLILLGGALVALRALRRR